MGISENINRDEERIRVSLKESGRTRLNKSNLKRERSKCRSPDAKIDDFNIANEFLNHFHAIASRSLDVIYEINDLDDIEGCDDVEYYFKLTHKFDTSLPGYPGLRRTKTCACLLDAQHSQAMNLKSNSSHDEEWGFYCGETS
jgi:hypothetical protein